MDKKKWTRVLIVIVAGLWGYNIYRTVENYQVKTEFIEERANKMASTVPMLFNKDTFNLELPNNDPFLRGQSNWQSSNAYAVNSNNGNNSRTNLPVNPPEIKPVETLKWPTVKYFGFLRRIEQDHQLCMLNINGKNYRLSVGEEKENLKVIQAYPDSVVVMFQNERKAFFK